MDAVAAHVETREAAVGASRTWFSAHRLPFLGAWSIEVIKAALMTRNVDVNHYPSEAAGTPESPRIVGFLLNRPASGVSGYLGGRHWVAFLPAGADGAWSDFDSQHESPQRVGGGSLADMVALLGREPAGTHVFLARRK